MPQLSNSEMYDNSDGPANPSGVMHSGADHPWAGGAPGIITIHYPSGDVYEGTAFSGEHLGIPPIPHGHGRMGYASGSVYEGQWENGHHCGHGKNWYANGDVYEGWWWMNQYHGHGRLVWAGGDKYEGEWAGDKMNGKGTYFFETGNVYEGGWKGGTKTGWGTLRQPDGAFYEGGWKGDEKHGPGTLRTSNGDVFKGQWVDGSRHGVFMHTEASSGHRFEYKQEYCNGKRVSSVCTNPFPRIKKDDNRPGRAKIEYRSGNIYEGDVVDGESGPYQHGHGQMQYANGEVYDGEWKYGSRHGRGTCKYPSGNLHRGQRKQHGKYDGDWADDEMHGKGEFTYADGAICKGVWNNGLKHGLETHRYADGFVQEQMWKNGERVFFSTPPPEKIRHALASILLADGDDDRGGDGGMDGKFVSYLADLLYESELAQWGWVDLNMGALLRPWLKGFRQYTDNLAQECSDAVVQCAKGWKRQESPERKKTKVMFVKLVDESLGTNERYALLRSSPLEILFNNYAARYNVSAKRLNVQHNGSALFMSSIGKKPAGAVGLKTGDEIKIVAVRRLPAEMATTDVPRKSKCQTPSPKRKQHKKSNRKKSMPALPTESEEDQKISHSESMTKVFEEADSHFRVIRQRLTAMNLQRTMP
ncbi:hypothetical protein ACHAXT_003602, partial [Thalassiosira profunda]